MPRLFYVLLIIPGIIAMEKEKGKQPESPRSIQLNITEESDELVTRACQLYELGETFFQQAPKESPTAYAKSSYEKAEICFSNAHYFWMKLFEKNYPGARAAAKHIYDDRLVELQKIKASLARNYSLSENWSNATQKEKQSPIDNKITWIDMLKETAIQANINNPEELKKIIIKEGKKNLPDEKK